MSGRSADFRFRLRVVLCVFVPWGLVLLSRIFPIPNDVFLVALLATLATVTLWNNSIKTMFLMGMVGLVVITSALIVAVLVDTVLFGLDGIQ